jgi:integrase
MTAKPKNPAKTSGPLEVKQGSVTILIYHTPGTPYTDAEGVVHNPDGWTLVYYDTDGKRKRLFRADLADAKREADIIKTRLAKAQAEVMKLSNEDVSVLAKAKLSLAPFGKTIEATVADHVRLLTKLDGIASPDTAIDYFLHHTPKNLVRRTVAEAVKEFKEAKEQDGLGDRHRTDLRLRLDHFASKLNCPMSDLTGSLIDEWLRKEQKANEWTGRTRNHYRSAISNLISFAKLKKYLPLDWAEMEFVAKAIEEDGEIGIFTPKDLSALLKVTPADLIPFVVLGAFSGPRPSEIQRAHWPDLHWESGEFFVGKGKVRTAGHRVAPLLDNAKAWLKPHRKDKGLLCVHKEPHKHLQKVVLDAGITWVHDGLRHSFVSYRIAITDNVPQVSRETGTDVETLHRRYCKPVKKSVAEEWFSLVPKS